ncbi:Os05g0392000 [Oryza sativa Japonica Group]|uniref:Os05g0392000 protein n=1 Tax=Oryza sativa subsp. japonica TaxID=39947 RepID=Q60ES4_ORYSJ|nr:unknown protein [Oryza sativa Japonica Group]BAH93137.1 Os05g0392000 [Oryza sativa Japonica Group]|eukprot:NP_001174409.1 Os05g0392000 [Oryza sativa Japonica Group]
MVVQKVGSGEGEAIPIRGQSTDTTWPCNPTLGMGGGDI